MNKVFLVGRLTRDLELRSTGTVSVLRNSLAVNRRVRAGEEQKADFISIVAFGQTADTMSRFLHKGSLIAIDGRIQTGSYERDGQTVYTTDVVVDNFDFCEKKGESAPSDFADNGNSSANEPANDATDPFATFGNKISLDDDVDSGLPF